MNLDVSRSCHIISLMCKLLQLWHHFFFIIMEKQNAQIQTDHLLTLHMLTFKYIYTALKTQVCPRGDYNL